jgi:hypothetical protein
MCKILSLKVLKWIFITLILDPSMTHSSPLDTPAHTNVRALIRSTLNMTGDYVGALRIKPADDGSCLWTVRCQDVRVKASIKKAVDSEED